jgi:hypothetical protein
MRRTVAQVTVAMLALVMTLVPLGGHAIAQESTPVASPQASPVAGTGLEGATAWLLSQQDDDGGFPGFSGESDPGTTLDAIYALVAAEHSGIDIGGSVDDAIAYLGSGDIPRVYTQTGVGQAAKLVLGLIAAGEDPRDIGGFDPLAIVEHGQDAETGIYGTGIFDHALSLMALGASGLEIQASAIDVLTETQAENGGWAFDASTDPAMADSNTTSLVVQTLVATGNGDSELVTSGMAYLETTITDDGALYAVSEGAAPDANSTALVIQALIATGSDASALTSALAAFQNPSGGLFYQSTDMTDNLFSTAQAIPALAGQPLPVLPEGNVVPVAGLWLVAA